MPIFFHVCTFMNIGADYDWNVFYGHKIGLRCGWLKDTAW
jgi:hypothetical protein